MRNRKIAIFLSMILMLFLTILTMPSRTVTLYADTGPKPSYEIKITNLEKSDYIIGFGFKGEYYGPHRSYTPEDPYDQYSFGTKEELDKLYNKVTLPSDWNLCDISKTYENTSSLLIKSGYWYPMEFILIVYNETSNTYYLTSETKTYAFNSYFEFDMKDYVDGGITLNKANNDIELEKNYQYWKEILEFFVRLIVCLGIELGLAFAFRFNKKSIKIISLTNVLTQLGLNLSLNLVALFVGKNILITIIYGLIEIVIVAIEATIFKIFCRRKDEDNRFIILYTIIANIVSFVAGMILWLIMFN